MTDGPTSILRALADPGRRRLYERLCYDGEAMVGMLAKDSGASQSTVSQQIRILIDCGLVIGRHDGPRTFYRAEVDGIRPLTDWLNVVHRPRPHDPHAALAYFRNKAAGQSD